MATDKRKLTKEELSAIRRAAAMARKTHGCGHNGGRPRGSTVGAVRKITVYTTDHQAFVKIATIKNMTVVDFMHTVAEALKARNEEVFSAPEVKI